MKRPDGLRLIGLTGGIGAGKSEVARVFRGAGIPVVDADRIAREQMRGGHPVYDEVVATFGRDVLDRDGEIARRRLARVVFADPERLRTLNRITHPHVVAEVERRLAILAEMGHPVAVIEAALLVETGLHGSLDGLVTVTASEDVRAARAAARDGVSPDEVRARMAAQTSDAERTRVATWVLANDGSLEDLRRRAARLAVLVARDPREGTP